MNWKIVVATFAAASILARANAQIQSDDSKNRIVPISSNVLDLKRHYFSIAFAMEAESKFRDGISLGYSITPDKRRKYYLGIQLNIVAQKSSSPIDAIYHGLPTANGNLTTRSSATTIELTQHYFFGSNSKTIPFISLNVGWRTLQNDLETSFIYNSGFPFGWLPNGDDVNQNSSAYSLEAGFGYMIKILGQKGLQIKLGLKNTGGFQIIDEHSVRYDSEGIRYNTYQSNPVLVTFSVGFAL